MADGYPRRICLNTIAGLILCSAYLLSPTFAKGNNLKSSPTMETTLKALPDDIYQFCTQQDPKDWRDGAGTCLVFSKQGTAVDGYYGYPHSSTFVCLQGKVVGNWLEGRGLLTLWAGGCSTRADFNVEWTWAQQDRLVLTQGQSVSREGREDAQVSWVLFQTSRLNMQGLYKYDSPRMTSPHQLCDWTSTLKRNS